MWAIPLSLDYGAPGGYPSVGYGLPCLLQSPVGPPVGYDKASVSVSRTSKRRGRQRKVHVQDAFASTFSSPPNSSPRASFAETTPPSPQSPAEILELLVDQSPKVATYAPPPVAFPTGAPLHQEPRADLGTGHLPFWGWRLEDVAENQEISNGIVDRLDAANKVEQSQFVTWLLKDSLTLSLTRCGTRVVQKALEVANSSDRDRLVESLEPFVENLYDSPHGNHVLTKIVEVMPSAALGCVIDKLSGKGRDVARHRFGCRVLERLIEHCDESQIGGLIDEIVPESAALCRHPYGNFVIQHLIEHSVSYRGFILKSILPDVPLLASHRIASHVVQKVMDHSDKDSKQAIVASLLKAESPNSLADIACNRYGSFVVEQLAGMSEAGSEVKECIAKARASLSQSEFGKHVLECFGLTIWMQEPSLPSSSGTCKL